jgi:hypothetical protein
MRILQIQPIDLYRLLPYTAVLAPPTFILHQGLLNSSIAQPSTTNAHLLILRFSIQVGTNLISNEACFNNRSMAEGKLVALYDGKLVASYGKLVASAS